ncbi:MAG TPA: VacJ family lipoprotein, partial [Rhodospirillales bacterium]|nr:VacJ family lipoprotein [Rhodospirillales bacterium]
ELKKDKWLNDWLSTPLPGQDAPPKVVQTLPKFQPIHPLLDNAKPKTPSKEALDDRGDTVPSQEVNFNDPLEPMNRLFFGFNEILQDYLLHPMATAYNWLPKFVRSSVSNFLLNLRSPIVLVNDILQFEPKRALQTTGRALINSTMGVGGLIDVADQFGIEPHDEDFGQTLAVWGVGEMFYLVLPVIGPTNPRDAIGKLGVDLLMDPLNYYLNSTDKTEWIWARAAFEGFEAYAGLVGEMDHVKNTSMDYYAAIRSMYRQRREKEILNSEDPPFHDIPDNTDEMNL